jgi:acyl-homoserine lactone acylase PvdQ
MRLWLRDCFTLLVVLICCCGVAQAENVTVYRDSFGVPHIYADTLSGAAFAAGYSQAEDRLEQLLQNYRMAAGTLAEVAGPDALEYDIRSRVWQHEAICRELFAKIDPKLQDACRAYIAGVEHFMAEHPDQKPAWAQKLEPFFPIMLGRFIIWGWPEGQAADDLQNAGIEPQPVAYRGSNQWVVAPKRSANGAPIALIDPHLSWYGPFRFYEQRMYAAHDDLAISGACILGVPMPGLGHNQYLSIAMTTGGPDTADVYEETLGPDGTYQVDGEWRKLQTRVEKVRVRMGDKIEEREVKVLSTHHGPVVAQKDGKAYTMAIPYMHEAGLIEELYNVMRSKNLAEAKRALATCHLMPQNVMIATVDGDVFYVRTGRVPVRNHGLPTHKPIPGNNSKNDYAGIHRFSDLVQIENPPQGYMQNNNVSPEHMMKQSPLVPEQHHERFYLYFAEPGPAHQRARATLEQLAADEQVTREDALEIAFSTEVWAANEWQQRLQAAWQAVPDDQKTSDARQVYDQIAAWDRHSRPDSIGALSYYYFKRALGDELAKAVHVPDTLANEQIAKALGVAAESLRGGPGKLDARFGDLFRVGREGGDRTWPVGGGSLKEVGMATPRAVSFHQDDKLRLGHGGQTSTQVVFLTKPPKSYMVLPLGESDHKESGHWDDQAEKLFSAGKAKDTHFLDREGVKQEATATVELKWPPQA